MSVDPTSSDTLGAPLSGRSVVVTRTREQSAALADPLAALGATVTACPVIAIVEPPDPGPVSEAIRHLAEYDWVVLTSANAVDRFLDRVVFTDRTACALDSVRIAVVGSATARALERRGVTADLVPADFRAEGLVAELARLGAGAGWRVLIPRALEAREILPDTLREMGCRVDVAPVYRTVPAPLCDALAELLARGPLDIVAFTSPSTARNFMAMLAQAGVDPVSALGSATIASIGPVTSDAVRALGFSAAIEPAESTVPALVEAIVAHAEAERA